MQEEHWFDFQLTILVHVMYIANPNYYPQDEHSQCLWTKYFYYISDDHKHDSLFVHRCLNLH